LVERFLNKIKQWRRVATRYDKLAANYLAFIKLASIRIWLRAYESAPFCNGLEERATKLVNARPEVFVPAFAAWLAPLRQPAPPTTLRLAQRPTLN
jgi:hypothetical protein